MKLVNTLNVLGAAFMALSLAYLWAWFIYSLKLGQYQNALVFIASAAIFFAMSLALYRGRLISSLMFGGKSSSQSEKDDGRDKKD